MAGLALQASLHSRAGTQRGCRLSYWGLRQCSAARALGGTATHALALCRPKPSPGFALSRLLSSTCGNLSSSGAR
jgi:hypothetical protein